MFKAQNFTVASPSATWTLTHNFSAPVNADVFIDIDGSRQKGYPVSMVQDEDRNVLTITWSAARAGAARVVAINTDAALTTNPSWIPDDASNL